MDALLPENGTARLAELHRYTLLDATPETDFDDLAQLAARICDTPIALISLVDAGRRWLKSSIALDVWETSSVASFCAHTILQSEPLIIRDTLQDARFACAESIRNAPHIRFYAGVSLVSADGHSLGTLSVADRVPRDISDKNVADLQTIARQIVKHLDLRQCAEHLARVNDELRAEIVKRERDATQLRLLQSVVVNANDAVLITQADQIDADGTRIIYVNEAFTRMTGYTADEVVGKTPRILHGLKTNRKELDKVRHALEHWQPVRAEIINYRKDGTEFWVELNVSPVADESGWYTHWVSVQRDVTERKRIEEVLRESEVKQRSLIESLPVVVYMSEPEPPYSPIYVSQNIESLGFSIEEWLAGKDLWVSILHPEDREWVLAETAAALASGRDNEYQYRIIGRDGGVRWFHDRGRFVRNDEGKPMYWQGVVVDITARKEAEAALRASEDRYRQIVEQATEIIYKTDAKGFFTFTNHTFSRLLQYPDTHLSGLRYTDVIRSDVRAKAVRFYTRQLFGNIANTYYEVPIVAQDGTEIWIGQNVQLVYEGEQVTGFQSVARDITARKQAEEAQQKTSLEIASILSSISDAFLTLDRQWRFTYLNAEAERTFGKTQAELKGRSISEVIPDIFNSPYYEPCRRAMNERVTVDFQAFSELVNTWFSIRAYPSESGLSIYFQDITERKQFEEDARKSEAYRSLFNHANDPIIIYEPDTEIVLDVSDKACEVYGFTRTEFIGMSMKEISFGDNDGAEQMQALLINGISQEYETVRRRADGTPIYLQINSSLIEFNKQRAILCINRDVTSRKQTERALHEREEQLRQSQKMEAIGQLAGGVAHDFNNLLTTILLNTQLGLARLDDEKTLRRRFSEIEKSSERAAALTRQLLAFSRRQTLERKSINLDDTTADIMKMVRRIIGENIDIHVQSAGNLPTIFADPTQIEQVLMNLAINARDAMPGGGLLKIETHVTTLDEAYCHLFRYAKPGRYVQMRVTDTGCGMDAETKRRIFEPFFTTKEIGKGTGLGLAMVYGIIKQHNGLIEVYSEPGQGTTFEIFLPVEDNPIEVVAEPIESELQGGTETILLVEDEDSLRRLAGTVLEELGYNVLLASDGIAGVETFARYEHEIDLVILDVVMPRMSGRDAYERIRAISPSVAIMFTTGYSAEMAHTRFIEDTGSALMQKPYSVDSFARKVRDVIEANLQP